MSDADETASVASSNSAIPKRIVLLSEPDGDVVARHTELGQVAGEFVRAPTGEIYFCYLGDERRWYVNKCMEAFCESAGIFNRCCEAHADDEDSDDAEVWAMMAAKLKRDFESIEPLGDPETALWSATVEDGEGGLLSLC